MTSPMPLLPERIAWNALRAHYATLAKRHLRAPRGGSVAVDGRNAVAQVHAALLAKSILSELTSQPPEPRPRDSSTRALIGRIAARTSRRARFERG